MEETALTSVNHLPSPLEADHLIQMAELGERRIEAFKKIKTLALAITNESDWIDESGKPYLQVSGAEKIAGLFSITWRINEGTESIQSDGHFDWEFSGLFVMPGREIEGIIGTRRSRDPFFCRANGQDIPPDQINGGNVKKAALPNCIGNGVSRILGLRNMTWEEIHQIRGFNKSKVAAVDRKSKKERVTQKEAGMPCAPKFGSFAGQPLAGLATLVLMWYSEAMEKALEDKSKGQYKVVNQQFLNNINAELDRRTQEQEKPLAKEEPSGTNVEPPRAESAGSPLEYPK